MPICSYRDANDPTRPCRYGGSAEDVDMHEIEVHGKCNLHHRRPGPPMQAYNGIALAAGLGADRLEAARHRRNPLASPQTRDNNASRRNRPQTET